MTNHTLTISAKTAKGLVSLLEQMAIYEDNLRQLRARVLRVLPESFLPYGGQLWWEKEECLADEDTKTKRISKAYDDADRLIRDLKRGESLSPFTPN